MATAKKAAAKAKTAPRSKPATTAEEVESSNTSPELRDGAEAMPARLSEAQNGLPTDGPDPTLGMTLVEDRSDMPQVLRERADKGETVRMQHVDGHEADVEAADVEVHKRSGWKLVEELEE